MGAPGGGMGMQGVPLQMNMQSGMVPQVYTLPLSFLPSLALSTTIMLLSTFSPYWKFIVLKLMKKMIA